MKCLSLFCLQLLSHALLVTISIQGVADQMLVETNVASHTKRRLLLPNFDNFGCDNILQQNCAHSDFMTNLPAAFSVAVDDDRRVTR
jgi:hypothetical protein